MKNNTKKLTVSAMLCALSCVLMLAGSLIDVMDMSVAAIASFAVVFAILELHGAYPALIFSVSCLLGLLLVPSKLPAIYYLLFFGWYPMLKFPADKLKPLPAWLVKLLIFAMAASVMALVGAFIAGTEDTMGLGVWLYVLCIPVFAIYDIALSRMARAYLRVWRARFKIDLLR